MVELIPAVLPKSFAELTQVLGRLHGLPAQAGVSPIVQVDLVGTNVLAGQYAMPLWEEFDFEFDIMLHDPRGVVEQCIDLGASRVVVHAEAQSAKETVAFLQPMRGGEFPVEVGVALRAHDVLDALEPFGPLRQLADGGLYDYVQVMGIDHIGQQGEPPDPHGKEIELIRALREQFPDLVIQVDGAVAPHVRELVAAGANRLVVGSVLTQANNPKIVYKALYTEANR